MANDITKPNGGALAFPADFAERLSAGIADARASTPVGSGKPFLKMMKGNGMWVYGANELDVQEGSHWAINPASLTHGYVCWIEGKAAGEIMVSMVEPKPPRPVPINGKPFSDQRGFDLRCLNGEDEGKEVVYKNNSYGFTKMTDGLLAEIRTHLMTPFPCPVVTFSNESYKHPQYGLTYNPILNIVGWCDMQGNMEGAPTPAIEAPAPAAPVAAPARQRRAPVASPVAEVTKAAEMPKAPSEAPAPVSTTQAHTGQRRRPPAR